MSSVSEQLDHVLQKTSRLIDLCKALQHENQLLRTENQQIQQSLSASRLQQADLEEKLRMLRLAKTIEGEGTNEKTLDIKQKINDFVREIDKCVSLLKK